MSSPVFPQEFPTAHDRLHWFAELAMLRARVFARAQATGSRRIITLAGRRVADALRAHEVWTSHVTDVPYERALRREGEAITRWLAVWSSHIQRCTTPQCHDCARVLNRTDALLSVATELQQLEADLLAKRVQEAADREEYTYGV